jgi:hypothetical protein
MRLFGDSEVTCKYLLPNRLATRHFETQSQSVAGWSALEVAQEIWTVLGFLVLLGMTA